MKEFTLNRLPEADVEGSKAFGRMLEEEEGSPTVPWLMVPDEVWANYGDAEQLNVQLSR